MIMINHLKRSHHKNDLVFSIASKKVKNSFGALMSKFILYD